LIHLILDFVGDATPGSEYTYSRPRLSGIESRRSVRNNP
jgi:hypothetical protein